MSSKDARPGRLPPVVWARQRKALRIQKLTGLCIICTAETGICSAVFRVSPKEKEDNETFAQSVAAVGRSAGHIRIRLRPQSSRSGRWADSGMPAQASKLRRLAAIGKVTKVTCRNHNGYDPRAGLRPARFFWFSLAVSEPTHPQRWTPLNPSWVRSSVQTKSPAHRTRCRGTGR
jgi:hypothetical protein